MFPFDHTDNCGQCTEFDDRKSNYTHDNGTRFLGKEVIERNPARTVVKTGSDSNENLHAFARTSQQPICRGSFPMETESSGVAKAVPESRWQGTLYE